MRWIHIVAGLIAIVSGAVALATLKGGSLHRRSGMVFVSAMLVMSSTAAVLAVLHQPHPGNVVAGVLTLYLVLTALLTVRRSRQHARKVGIAAMLTALALGLTCFGLGLFLEIDPRTPGGAPPRPYYFIIGAIAVWLAIRDMRLIAAAGLHGAARLRRHLGRMGAAMFIATGSFFLGQPRVFAGGPLESVGLRALPVIAVVTATLFWLVRVSRKPITADRRESFVTSSQHAAQGP
jgi:uncharacterized membrane protein